MLTNYVPKTNSYVDYYELYQEVQSAKQAARLNMKTELATHEREKHDMNVEERKSSMVAPSVGSLLDMKA